jgi:hypothetical protein
MKRPELKFGGAVELGSAAAYSAVAQARGQQVSSVQNQIATAARQTAEATGQINVGIQRVLQKMDQRAMPAQTSTAGL